jgi:5-methylcytosine-specific restriction endonuclease McrA
MTTLKRFPIKYIRDFIKKDYKLRDCCYICSSTKQLELHHLYSLSELFDQWCIKNRIYDITREEQMLELRVAFATECSDKLANDNLYTLCSSHHKYLHNLYGQRYPNYLVPKVKNWIYVQKEKYDNS